MYMAEDIGSLAVSIGMDATGFTTGMTKLDQQLKVLNSAFKANTAAVGINGTALDKLKLKSSGYTNTLSTQQNKVAALEAAYNRSATATGKDSLETMKLETKLNSARASLSRLETSIAQTNAQILTQSSKWTTLGTSMNAAGEKMKTVGATTTSVGKKMTVGITAPIVGLGVAIERAGMDFETSMSKVQAMSGATGNDLQALKNEAIQLGQDTAFSAKEAADGMENLASAGFNTKEILAAMPGLLNLAASGGIAVADASDIASSALRGFGLDASASGHVADVLAATAAHTNAEVGDLGLALKYASPPAHALGMTIDETTAAIGEMSNAGIKGEMAGTTLRTALVALASPSKQAADMMKSIGFNAFDSAGKMLPFGQVLTKLQTSTKGLTQEQKANALATIFGRESLSGMLTLINEGPAKFNALSASLKGSDGAAAAMAKTMQDNAASSIEQMMGSLETAAIKLETDVAPTVRVLAKDVENAANAFSNLSPAVQGTAIKVALAIAVIGPLAVGFGSLITAAGVISTALGGVAIKLGLTTAAEAAAGVAATGAGAATTGLGAAAAGAIVSVLPFVIAGAALAAVGIGIHHALTQSTVPAVNLFGDKVTYTSKRVVDANGNISVSQDTTTQKISAGTQKAVGAYLALDQQATGALQNLYIHQTVLTAANSASMMNSYAAMNVSIKTALDKRYTDEKTQLATNITDSKALSAADQAQILAKMATDNTTKKATEQSYYNQINTIRNNAVAQHRALSSTEQAQINAIDLKMKTTAVKTMSDGELESKVILERLKAYKTTITTQQASDEIKNANKARDSSVKAANDKYTGVVKSAIYERDVTGNYTAAQAAAVIAGAEKTRKQSIDKAEATRSGVVTKITSMNSSISGSVNTTTGNIITYWDRLKTWWDKWTPTVKKFITQNVVVGAPASGGPAGTGIIGRASGDTSFQGGLTTLHEKGYEVYNLNKGSKILNHDASLDLITKTAQNVAAEVLKNNKTGAGNMNVAFDHTIINGYNDLVKLTRDLHNIDQNYRAAIGGANV